MAEKASTSAIFFQNPISQVRGGFYNYSTATLANRGTRSYTWSSSATVEGAGYDLNFNTSNVYPGTANNGKGSGFSLRCLAL